MTRLLSSSSVNQADVRYVPGRGKGPSPTKLRGRLIDGSDDSNSNIDALTTATLSQEVEVDDFQLYPDENTADKLFNGIKYKELPYITIKCTYNHTRFWINKADGTLVFYTSPKLNGFLNAKKRTNVAAQATGLIVGQRLRQANIKTVRVRITGFNAGRIASLKGLAQAGTTVVSLSDITTIDWHWAHRAKKPKRRN
jgi:small subunit ribosomal protein S11